MDPEHQRRGRGAPEVSRTKRLGREGHHIWPEVILHPPARLWSRLNLDHRRRVERGPASSWVGGVSLERGGGGWGGGGRHLTVWEDVVSVVTQAAAVTDAWDPAASRCLTCLRTLLSTAGLVYILALAAVHRAKRLAAREVAAFA